jgi:hypothetical protein
VSAALAVAACSVAVSTASKAGAASTDTYEVTVVARQCPTYTDTMANLARNDLQESLQDTGKDSAYLPGQPISPSIETPNSPNCTPMPGWKFSFGDGIAGKVSNLSTVSNPGAPVTVQPSTPLLDPLGRPTGQSIAAATTVTLTQAQVNAALIRKLWIQGGTPADPLVTGSMGSGYAFGALRCSIDDLNGDNVEWLGFSSGTTHVFCYYYAVHQAPSAGRIILHEQLGAGESGTSAFHFAGNVSFNPGGTFPIPLSGPAPSAGSVSFVRSAGSGVAWNFHQDSYPGFTLTSLTCAAPGGSATTTDLPTATATVTLVPDDTVTCTFVDSATVDNNITVVNQTTGGFGGPFSFSVTPPSGPTTVLSAATTAADTPVQAGAVTDVGGSGPQTYAIVETPPAPTPAGSWSVTGFQCTGGTVGSDAPTSPSQTVTLLPTSAVDCTYTDRFTPNGGLTITKTTLTGIGSTYFVVTPVVSSPDATGEAVGPLLNATTTEPGVAVSATQMDGNPLNPLAPGQYSIVEEGPGDSTAGAWTPESIVCTGSETQPTTADVLVTVTSANPHVTCAFTNTFAPSTPEPATITATASEPGSTAASSTSPGTSSNGQLAATGADVRMPLALALGLAVLGLALIGVDRMRRSRRKVPVHPGHAPPD